MKAHEEEWAKNGCSIMTDAWTDQKRRSIMNMCMHCTIGSSFLESKETSEESHTGQMKKFKGYIDQAKSLTKT